MTSSTQLTAMENHSRAAILGWPEVSYASALTLVALERLGTADVQAVQAERIKIAAEHGWLCGKSKYSAFIYLSSLEFNAYLVSTRNRRRRHESTRFRLRHGIKTMSRNEREQIAAAIRERQSELDELICEHRQLVKAIRTSREVQHGKAC